MRSVNVQVFLRINTKNTSSIVWDERIVPWNVIHWCDVVIYRI